MTKRSRFSELISASNAVRNEDKLVNGIVNL